jgi:hypothetical protein
MRLNTRFIYITICIFALIVLACLMFSKTDCEFVFNIIFRQNTHVNNMNIRKYWTQLTDIMYKHTIIIEPGTNVVPNKTNDIYEYFIDHSDRMNISNIAEIGFNAGHSCACLLILFPKSKITIFDLCEHAYTEECFNLLDNAFPNRLELIKGESTQTVPMYASNNYDLVHIDGGHFGDIPLQDLNNTYNHLLSNTGYIIFDDTSYRHSILLNTILSKCKNIFNDFVTEKNINILKVCNGSTISYVKKSK